METILQKLKSGEYKFSSVTGTSEIWKYYNKIEDTETEEIVPYVICPKCEKVFNFPKSASSSNLKKHSCYKRQIGDAAGSSSMTRLNRERVSTTSEQFHEEHTELNNTQQKFCEEDAISNHSFPTTSKLNQTREEDSDGIQLKQELIDTNESVREEDGVSTEILQKIENGEYRMSASSGSSEVWKYFHKIEDVATGENVPHVICAKCKKLFKFGKGASSSNLKKHGCYKKHFIGGASSAASPIKRKRENTDDHCPEDDSYSPIQQTKQELVVTHDPLWEEDNCWTSTKRKRFNINDQLCEVVLESCMKFMCHDLRDFDIINGVGFKELARCLVDVGAQIDSAPFSIEDILPQPTTIAHRLQQLHQNEREKFVRDMRPFIEKSMCASTVDIWEDFKKQRNFLTFTVHFIDNIWQLQSRILFTTEFEYCDENKISAKETPRNIIDAIEAKFDELNLDGNLLKKITFTAEQDTNIKKALQHNARINNCLSYILNNILESTFDKEFLEYDAPDIMDLITKCESLMSYLKQMGTYQIFESTMQQECATRWSVKFEMLWCLGKNFKAIEDIFKKSEQTRHLDGFEKQLLDKLINILKPFKNLINLVENKKTPTLHLVLLHMHILKSKLTDQLNKENNNEVKSILSNCLENIIDVKFRPDKIHKIAAFLWPQYKQLRYLSESERDEVYELVKAELLKISKTTYREIPQDAETDNLEVENYFDTDEMLSKYKDVNMQGVNYNAESQICIQIEMYKNSCFVENDVSNWWRVHGDGFPLMAKLARKFLCIPASSAASEKCFNLKQRSFEQRRTNLIGENVDAILFLHSQQNNQIQSIF